MADPQTPTIMLFQPGRGSDSGQWDLPVNANSGALDSLFGNVATIGLTNAPVTLTTPPNSGAAWNGPYQSQSALLQLTGAITASCAITIPRPGYYIVWNQCTSGSSGFLAGATAGSFFVQLTTGAAGGNNIGVPPGRKCHVFSDGTNMDFVNAPDAGTAYDLHGATAMPSWMTACTVRPYLIKDGSIYTNSVYPALASVLQNAFGGTAGLSFAVPDELARARIGLDTVGTNRLTTAGGGVNGTTMGSGGGSQSLQSHVHSVSIPAGQGAHFHGPSAGLFGLWTAGTPFDNVTPGGSLPAYQSSTTGVATLPAMSGTAAATGAGSSANVQPSIVSFLPLIKT